MQASRPRRLHTPVAIKLPSIPLRQLLRPSQKETAAGKPTGYNETPPQTAYRRCCQALCGFDDGDDGTFAEIFSGFAESCHVRSGKVSFQVSFGLPAFDDGDEFVSGFGVDIKTCFISDASVFGEDSGDVVFEDFHEFFHAAGIDFHTGENVNHFFYSPMINFHFDVDFFVNFLSI